VYQFFLNSGFHAQFIAGPKKLDCQTGLEAGIINLKLFIKATDPAGVKHVHPERDVPVNLISQLLKEDQCATAPAGRMPIPLQRLDLPNHFTTRQVHQKYV
jgi:hypothetical protein